MEKKLFIIETEENFGDWATLTWLKPNNDLSILWDNVTKAGWKFVCLDRHNNVIMTRNGYINKFRNKEAEDYYTDETKVNK